MSDRDRLSISLTHTGWFALRGCYLSFRWMWMCVWVISGVRDDIRSAFRLEFTMPSEWYNPSGDSNTFLTLSESHLRGNSMKTLLQLKHISFQFCDRPAWNVKPPLCHITRVCGALTAERIRSGLIWIEVCVQSDLESEAQKVARHHVTRTHWWCLRVNEVILKFRSMHLFKHALKCFQNT